MYLQNQIAHIIKWITKNKKRKEFQRKSTRYCKAKKKITRILVMYLNFMNYISNISKKFKN
jgi:hypothetical protein